MFPFSSGWYSISHSPTFNFNFSVDRILLLLHFFQLQHGSSYTYIPSYCVRHRTAAGTRCFFTIACGFGQWWWKFAWLVSTINVSDLIGVNDITGTLRIKRVTDPNYLSGPRTSSAASNPASTWVHPDVQWSVTDINDLTLPHSRPQAATNPSHPWVCLMISGCHDINIT